MPKLHFSQKIIFTFAVLVLLGVGFYVYAWTDPGQSPPDGNVPSLLDSGVITQTKTGGLNVLGNVGIGTAEPKAKLEVVGGDILTNGAITANGGSSVNWNSAYSHALDTAGNVHGADSLNTNNAIVKRDENGNFSAGVISAALTSAAIDLNGDLSVRAITAPTVSPATQGKIYFDSTANKFKISENGGAYQNLVSGAEDGGGWIDDGAVIKLATITDKVGIGTTNPASALHINALTGQYANNGSKPTMLLSYAGTTYANHYIGASWDYFIDNPYNSTAYGGIHIKTAGTERLTISKGGNIGIGATNPMAKLDVNGAIKANNHLTHLPWKNFADPPNGYIKLSTPIVHNESNMFSLRIFGYEYTGGSDTIDIKCVGYAYSATTLINTKCYTEGTDLAVEIGAETRIDQGGKTVVVIRIGTPTWDWYYPQLTAEYSGWKAKNEADFKWVTGETTPVQTGNTNNVVINDQIGNSWFNANGNVGIGTASPQQKLEVAGGMRLNTSVAKPACNASLRGTIWFTQGGAGAKDTVEICAKDAAGAYAWRMIW